MFHQASLVTNVYLLNVPCRLVETSYENELNIPVETTTLSISPLHNAQFNING